ncbi:hypothetical protein SLE2022_210950 [Rubroshorea leprosula]
MLRLLLREASECESRSQMALFRLRSWHILFFLRHVSNIAVVDIVEFSGASKERGTPVGVSTLSATSIGFLKGGLGSSLSTDRDGEEAHGRRYH